VIDVPSRPDRDRFHVPRDLTGCDLTGNKTRILSF
jgi:hypothetical protein